MSKLSRVIFAAAIAVGMSSVSFGYDYTSYNRSGLVIQYDGPDNEEGGGTSTTLANLGTMAPEYGLERLSDDDVVSDGVICFGTCTGATIRMVGPIRARRRRHVPAPTMVLRSNMSGP